MIFLEDEYRAFCPTGTGGGVKNDCSPEEGVGRVDNSWKREQGPVRVAGNDLKKSPPAKSLAGVKSVTMMDGELVNKALREVGVTLDQAAKACAAIDPQSDVMIAHGGLREIVEFMGSEEPDRYIEDTVTFTSTMPVAGITGAAQTAVSLTRLEDGELAMAYNMLMISDEAKKNASVAVARQMMKGTIASISQAEKIGVSRIEMLAAGDGSSGAEFKGYRIWPRLGFDGTIPRSRITPTWSLARGFFNSYGSGIPDKILSPRAKKEKAAGALTIQALYETKEGQEWWEKNGGEMKMSLSVGKSMSPGWKRFKALRDRFSKRSIDLADAFFDDEARSLLDADWAEIRAACIDGEAELRSGADCGRDEGGRFGSGNDCASDDESPMGDSDSIDMDAEAVSASPPFKGAEVLNSFSVNDVPLLKSMLAEFGEVKTVENVVAIAGGARQGGEISIDSFGEAILIDSAIPVSPDGSDRLGSIKNMVSIMRDDDGNLVVAYDSMSLDSKAMSSIDGESEGDSADRRRIVSLVLERMTESMSVAEKSGVVRADTIAAGNSSSALQGYRLWPQFGFDAPLDASDIVRINSEVKLTAEQKRKIGDLTVQDLIATPEGDRWWNENGTTIELSFDFANKESVGYKRFERMKKMLGRLRERNKNRSGFEDDVENRAGDCGRVEGGKFGPNNDCAKENGGSSPEEGKKQSSGSSNPLDWSPGDGHIDIFQESVANNPTKRSPDGKKIVSTSIKGAKVSSFAGKQEVDPVSVGNYLLARQREHRGRAIDTTETLDGSDFEYMVSGIVEQVKSAQSRGVSPNFYSPEDRRAQVEEYAKIQPLMRGGRTASGFCIGVEGPNGECEPSDGISPQAEFLFRAAQALTSPEANPYENMLRADSALTAFFGEPDPRKARLGQGIRLPGAGGSEAIRNFARLQKIIDRIGLDETRKLLTGPPIRVGDFEKHFLEKVPGSSGERYKPSSYAVDELVPPFSIFGPKVGPFFANNTGDDEALTADIWFTRTWGRLSGELVSETSAPLAKKHASELMQQTGNINRKELTSLGMDGRQFRTLVSQMKKSGEIPQPIADWAESRVKQYAKDGHPSPEKGTGTKERYTLDRLAGNILKNQTRVMRAPTTTVMRSNMIRVMREAAKRTGVPVAYMQDILWQDEQDAWGTLGSRTTTVPGQASLYSDVIRKIVSEPANYQKRRQTSRRSAGNVAEPMELQFYGDQKGGVEQAIYSDSLADMDDDEFADLAIAFLRRKAGRESRAFCPTGDGGGIDNSCGSDEGSAGPSDSGSTSRSPESLPKSFPRGSEKFRDAIDSVAPDPKAVWDRSRGRADTPPSKVLDTAADEQTSSGSTLTPEAEKSYAALIDEIGRQYEALTAAGFKARAWRGEGEPYGDPPGSTKPNSDQMRAEVARTGEFSFFMTDKGFGTGSATPNHPMLRETKYKTADGEPMIANDLFRVVHDMVAHVRGGYSFSTNGEFNGMLTHASTLPEEAWPALFAETFGQNAVYEKTGNYAAQNAYASKVGPEIIKAELAKRNRKVRRAVDAEDEGDEPLGYQHIKVRPWLMKGVAESRAYCPTGDGGGIDNSCSASDKGKEPIPAGDKSLKSYEPFEPNEGTKNSDFAVPPSDEEAIAALKEPQKAKYGAHRTLQAGYPIDLRIDIPAFKNHGAYVVTAHEHVNGAGVGPPIGYDSIIRLKGDVDFRVGETAATKIARGKTDKNTHSTVKGKFDPSRDIPEDIDDWTPVGYNPKTATYYYDKRNGKEIVGGVDSISVGNSVFVRVPKYGNGKDPSKPPRNAKTDYRSADCGRDESGKFGSGNDCASDGSGGGTATAAPSGGRWSSNETLSWPATSRDSSPPPVGDGRYGSISVSAPKAVKASLDAAGIDPKLAPMVAGGSEGSDVFVRPAPDFSMEFPGSDVTPVMFAFERDFAGVDGGLHGSSVIGVTASGEVVVHHSTISVSDKIKSDDSKRHAAAREFYRAMTASVEAARKAGVSRIVLNAAGNSSATKGSVTSTPWRGYTIWPRMGFDAPLPASIKAKLPPGLSHAKSLLDLHATQEGTRWWRDNGEDLDVSFDPNDRSSPQSKVMDRFIKKFGESRRDMPLGAGDEWLSPADLLRLDEMWQEIWDDGDLDDYEWTESRSSDCGRDESGKFGPKNDCASDDSPSVNPAVSSPKSESEGLTMQSLANGLSRGGSASKDPNESLKLLRTDRRFEIVGSFAKNIDARRPSDAADFASKFLTTLGTKTKKLPEAFVEDVSEDVEEGIRQSKTKKQGAERAACLLASISAAVAEHPEVLDATLFARDTDEFYDAIVASGDPPRAAQEASESAAAMYSILSDSISINTSIADHYIFAIAENAFAETKQFSSSHPGHALIHEVGHMVHYRALRASVGLPARGKISMQGVTKMFQEFARRANDVAALLNSGAEGDRAGGKLVKLSRYGASHPAEFVAEYYAGLATGAVARDADLDKVAVMLGFPADKLPEGKKKK